MRSFLSFQMGRDIQRAVSKRALLKRVGFCDLDGGRLGVNIHGLSQRRCWEDDKTELYKPTLLV